MNTGISRGAPIEIEIDGRAVTCFPGETIAAVLLANGQVAFRHDQYGKPRGPVCNMGVCFECLVEVDDGVSRRESRACMTVVEAGIRVVTDKP